MNDDQGSIKHNNSNIIYYQVCFFEKPYLFFTYQSDQDITLYSLVKVPFGRSCRIGMIWQKETQHDQKFVIKPIESVVTSAVLTPITYNLIEFCTHYYYTHLQDVLATAVPSFARKSLKLNSSIVAQRGQHAQLQALTQAQKNVVLTAQQRKNFHIHLLHGITGSGKTRCYLELMQNILDQSGNILLMVPEINLTPQLLDQIKQLVGAKLFVYHSQLTPKKRFDCFNVALSGVEGCIFLTTRSGIFLPIQNLKLIIVDEEHDSSYKQQEGPFRYHAKDLAIKLAQLHDCPCILGSATPSLKMIARAFDGQILYSKLDARATGQPLPDFRIQPGPRATWTEPLSFQLLKEVRDTLLAEHQVLFYLNRRGYVPRLFCPDCKESLLCQSCLTPFVYHLDKEQLNCHHCGKCSQVPTACPSCQHLLVPLGFGTERLAEFLRQTFPSYPVFVVDTDHLTTHKQVTEELAAIRKEKAALIIGTQMIGKGHDWPLVKLAVLLISAHHLEHDLNEQVAQQIVQAAGRCGRHVPGVALIPLSHDQESIPSSLNALVAHDYAAYSNQLLLVKKKEGLPPFGHQAKILFRCIDLSSMLAALREMKRKLLSSSCQGPFLDYPMKRGSYWQAYLLIQCVSRIERKQLLDKFQELVAQDLLLKKMMRSVDIDPTG
jgi:primosomal protein N' (replication factor Y)